MQKDFFSSEPVLANEMSGLMNAFTSELMMALNAAPMTTPTARSTTLPRKTNWRNSFSMRRSLRLERGAHEIDELLLTSGERFSAALAAADRAQHARLRQRTHYRGVDREQQQHRILAP